MSKSEKLVTILLVIFSFFIGWFISDLVNPSTQKGDYSNKIDSLLIVNDSLFIQNNLLRERVDSLESLSNKVDSVIVEIEHWYEKELIDITNQPISSDIRFFTEYLSKTDSGFISSNNPESIKED